MKVDLEKLLVLESKATPGNWLRWFHTTSPQETEDGSMKQLFLASSPPYPLNEGNLTLVQNDAELIVAMRNNIRQLCLELKAARQFMPVGTTAKEIVKATKLLLSSEGLDQSQLKLYLHQLIRQYDEVTGKG